MMQNRAWRKPLSIRLGQSLWAKVRQWSKSTGWPLDGFLLRLSMIPLLPLYCLRLGLGQGLSTFYRFFFGDGGFTIYRSDRDLGTDIRDDSTDPWVFQQIFILQDYRRLAGRQDVRVIIDAGAYVGFSAIYFAELYPHAFIYALEPEESNFQALQRNTRHYPNIKAIQAALWKSEGYLNVKDIKGGQWSFLVEESEAPGIHRIPAVTVQNLIDQYRLPKVDILKIDVEGSEGAIFEDASCHEWMPKVRLLSIELHDHLFAGSDYNFVQALSRYRFTSSHAGENLIFEFQDNGPSVQEERKQQKFS